MHDGDTIEVLHNQHPERIRLSGIDCPEKGQVYGKRAKHAASELVYGKEVTLQTHGRDKYKRTIGDVILPDGMNLNQELVKQGWCWWYRKYAYEPLSLLWCEDRERGRSGSLSQAEHLTMRRSSPLVLKLLATYYLIQGVLLAAVGAGGLLLLDQNHLLVLKQWLQVIHLDPENRSIHWLLTKVLPITDQLLETLSIGSFVYAGLAFVQGGGLLFAQPWASYLTVIGIGSFIPWELYGMLDHVTPLRLTTLGINGVIVWYLLVRELRARRVKKNGCEREHCHR